MANVEKKGKTPEIIVVEACISAGKSTLLPLLREHLETKRLKVAVAPEPVQLWEKNGILGSFYDDMERFAEVFQNYVYVTRIQAILNAVKFMPDADILLVERSVLTDRFIFMELQRSRVGAAAIERYESWADTFDRLLHPLDLKTAKFLYLKPSVSVCMERMAKRARAAESKGGVTREYQELLHRAHEALFQGWHTEEFPRSQNRPFPLSNVVVIESDLANQNFSSTASLEEKTHIATEILNKLGYSDRHVRERKQFQLEQDLQTVIQQTEKYKSQHKKLMFAEDCWCCQENEEYWNEQFKPLCLDLEKQLDSLTVQLEQ